MKESFLVRSTLIILALGACSPAPVEVLPTELPTLAPTAPQIPPPALAGPDLSTMSVRSLSSTSPDGQWRADALLASFAGERPSEYARVSVFRADDSTSWTPYEMLSEYGGLGSSYISSFYWAADGGSMYFTHTGTSEPCGYGFTSNLHRVDLQDGSLSEIPLTGKEFGEITISPGAERMAYRTGDGILIYDLADGSSRILPYPWPGGFGYVVGWNAWSPNGEELAFSITKPLCDSLEPASTATRLIHLETGTVRQPAQNETWLYLPDQITTDPIPTAALVLHDFLNSLYWASRGGQEQYTYDQASALYGGSYELLITMNPDIDPSDHAALFQNACEVNGFQCLRLRDVISSHLWRGLDGAWVVSFTVYLTDLEGGIFALGACCGEEPGLPQTRFDFSVGQFEDGTPRVMELPPFVP